MNSVLKHFAIILIYVFAIFAGACISVPGWKYRGNSQAHGVLAHLGTNRALLTKEYQYIQKCLINNGVKPDIQNLTVFGETTIHEGYLSISKISLGPSEFNISESQMNCILSRLETPKKNVANGILYNPPLLKRDFIYKFEGTIFPTISGTVKSVDYEETESF